MAQSIKRLQHTHKNLSDTQSYGFSDCTQTEGSHHNTHILLSDSDRGHTDMIQGAISSTFVAVFLIHKILQHREIARTVCTLILLCILPRHHAWVEARGVEQEFPPALPTIPHKAQQPEGPVVFVQHTVSTDRFKTMPKCKIFIHSNVCTIYGKH